MIMVTSGATVGVATALNAVSAHGACTAVFMVVACVAGILLGSIRTIGNLTWIGWVGLTSLMVAIITLTVAVGVQSRPAMAPENWVKDVKVFGNPTFPQAMNAVSSVIFSYGSTVSTPRQQLSLTLASQHTSPSCPRCATRASTSAQ